MGTIDFTDSIYDAQQGSQSAVKFIYDNTIQQFYKETAVFMRSTEDADEAIRDTYLFIFDHLDSLEDTSRFLMWANEVCKNTCIAKLKQANVFRERIPAEAANLGEVLAAADFDPAINWQASMSAEHIRVCLGAILDSLPDSQRVCAILWSEGYPLRSISRKLGISTTAVNYIIACTLGSITNAVTTLGENGLPLYSMEPIPYFLWLLYGFYQNYQPEEVNLGPESAFSNVLRILMPEEASLYDFDEEVEIDEETQVIADEFFENFNPIASEFPIAPGYGDELETIEAAPIRNEEPVSEDIDVSDFISGDLPAEDVKTEDESEDAENNENESTEDAEEPEGASAEAEEDDDTLPVPPMDVYTAGEDSIFAAGTESKDEGEAITEEELNKEESSDSEQLDVAAELLSGMDTETAADPAFTAVDGDKKKSHKGLIITLIIIAVIICLGAAAFIFYGDYVKEQINSILGRELFPTVQEIPTEPETEPETEAPTEPETTTEPETEAPTEPETTTEEVVGPEYTVEIYADGEALSMKAVPDGERLNYIPSGEHVLITETQDGWGHTSFDGEDGWIWLEFTKVVGKAPVRKPEADTMLETPEVLTLGEDVEMRTDIGHACSTFGIVPAGTEMTVEAYYEDPYFGTYAYTSYEGNHGWLPAESLY